MELGPGDRRRSGVRDLHPRSSGASAAAADDGLLAAALLGVVGAAAARAEEPGEQSAAARRLDLAAARLDLGAGLFVAGHRLAVGRDQDRLAVREQPRQGVAAHPRPVAHRAAVDMDPRRCAAGIEADAALLHAHRDVADARRADVDEMRVDGAPFHVLRILGDLARAPAQHGVRLRRAVSRQHVDRLGGAGFAVDFPDDVEEARVHFGRLVEPPVAHEPVELVEHRLVVDAVDHIGERTGLAGVLVRKGDRARVPVGDGGFGRVRREPRRDKSRRHGRPRRRAASGRSYRRQPLQQIILLNCGAPNHPPLSALPSAHLRMRGSTRQPPVPWMSQDRKNQPRLRIDPSCAQFNVD